MKTPIQKLLIVCTLLFSVVLSQTAFAAPRSQAAKNAFAKLKVCPSTQLHKASCPGYVIDHIKPLACGGADAPKNMQWQTVAAGKAKDKIERKGCKK